MILLRNNEILLGKRHEDPQKADSIFYGSGKWTLPGGKLNFQETFEDGAYREVLEETGIKINKDSLKHISTTNNIVENAHFITLGFLCEKFEGEAQVMEPDEITHWQWFGLNGLPVQLYFPTEQVLNIYLKKQEYKL